MGHLLRRDAADCERHGAGARARSRGARPHRESFPQQRETASAAVRRVCRQGLQNRGRLEDSPARRAWRRRRSGERAEGVPARSECGVVASGAARLPDCAAGIPGDARFARRSRLLRDARPGAVAAGADGRVRAQPVPARGALSPCAARRVPGHEPRAMDARRDAHPIVGRGQRHCRRRSARCLRSFSSAIASSRFTGSATPTSPSWTRPARSSTSCAPTTIRAGRFRRASARFRSCSRSRTTCSRRSKRIDERRDAFRFGEHGQVSGRRCRVAAWARRSGIVAAPSVADHADAVAAEIRRLLDARRSSATQRRASRGRSAPRTSASCFERRTAIRISRKRSSAGRFRRTSTRGSAFSRPTKSRTSSRCCAISRRPSRICARRRSCARGSSGFRIPRCRRSPRISHPRCRAAASTWLPSTRGSPRARAGAPKRRAMARPRRSTAARRSARAGARRNRLHVRDARAACAAGARKPEEDPRDDSPRPEPRLRDHVAAGRTSRAADGR